MLIFNKVDLKLKLIKRDCEGHNLDIKGKIHQYLSQFLAAMSQI